MFFIVYCLWYEYYFSVFFCTNDPTNSRHFMCLWMIFPGDFCSKKGSGFLSAGFVDPKKIAGSHLAPRSIWAWQIKLIKIGWNKVRHEEPTSWNIKINNIHSNASRNEACHRYFFSRNFVDAWKTCHPSWLAQAVGFTVSLEVQFPLEMGGVCSFLRDVWKLHPQNSMQICAAYGAMMALT